MACYRVTFTFTLQYILPCHRANIHQSHNHVTTTRCIVIGPPRTASLYRAPQGQPAYIGPPRTAILYRRPSRTAVVFGRYKTAALTAPSSTSHVPPVNTFRYFTLTKLKVIRAVWLTGGPMQTEAVPLSYMAVINLFRVKICYY